MLRLWILSPGALRLLRVLVLHRFGSEAQRMQLVVRNDKKLILHHYRPLYIPETYLFKKLDAVIFRILMVRAYWGPGDIDTG